MVIHRLPTAGTRSPAAVGASSQAARLATVVPGLMRTGSHLQARFTGQAGKEFTRFALGASLPLLSMGTERAARQIIEAVSARRAEIILTRPASLSPGWPAWRPG
jgi:hypothetical protein